MSDALKRFQSLTATDLMTKEVVQIPHSLKLTEAASILRKHQISGAPVIDEAQRCVGVISASDFVKKESDREKTDSQGFRGEEHCLDQAFCVDGFHIEEFGEELVSTRMTPAVQTVNEKTSVFELANEMCSGHIHRLIVVDEEQRVTGMVTTLDVIAAFLNVVEEDAQCHQSNVARQNRVGD